MTRDNPSGAVDRATSLINRLIQHPLTQQFARHALRVATAALVRAVRNHTRTRRSGLHIS